MNTTSHRIKTYSALAAMIAVAAAPAETHAGHVVTVDVTPQGGGPTNLEFGGIISTGADDPWLAANNMISVSIFVDGIPEGFPTLGVFALGQSLWSVQTTSTGGFHNYAESPLHEPDSARIFDPGLVDSASDPGAAAWDSGFIGLPAWSFYRPPAGETAFTVSGGGGNEASLLGGVITVDEEGTPAPGGPIELFRVTWGHSGDASGTFNLILIAPLAGEPSDVYSVSWSVVPAPGALALLGVAGLVGPRRRR